MANSKHNYNIYNWYWCHVNRTKLTINKVLGEKATGEHSTNEVLMKQELLLMISSSSAVAHESATTHLRSDVVWSATKSSGLIVS